MADASSQCPHAEPAGYVRLRDGRVAGPLEWIETDRPGWPWRAGRHAFTIDGRYAANVASHPHDIVARARACDRLDDADLAARVRDGFARRDADGTRVTSDVRLERVIEAVCEAVAARAIAPNLAARRRNAALRRTIERAFSSERSTRVAIDRRVMRVCSAIRKGVRAVENGPPLRAVPAPAPAPAPFRRISAAPDGAGVPGDA